MSCSKVALTCNAILFCDCVYSLFSALGMHAEWYCITYIRWGVTLLCWSGYMLGFIMPSSYKLIKMVPPRAEVTI